MIAQFGAIEDGQRYGRLAELFTDDAVYYDPLAGPQRGTVAIAEFMARMERVVPAAGITFRDWEVQGDTNCGWARWMMTAPGPDGTEVTVPGQSLYRLREGRVCFAADYLDPVAYGRLRPGASSPDAAGAAGLSAGSGGPSGPALEVVRRFWSLQDSGDYARLAPLFADDAVFTDLIYGDFHGGESIAAYLEQMKSEMPARGIRFELVDAAGDETVAWSQWWCHFPTGRVPGWTLHTVRDGKLTLDADYFDTAAARSLS